MSPISTNANLCRLLILPCGECSKAGMMYQLNCSQERVRCWRFPVRPVLSHGVVEYAQHMMLIRACAPANCGCTLFPGFEELL